MAPYGCRRADRPRRPRAQPEGHHRPAPAERPHLHHRALRLREVEPRVRHDLRRGPAALRRVALRVRAPVPADDGEARRRLDRRAQPGDLDRPEDDLAEPALDGRHRHRDLRLPPAALRAGGPSALPGVREADLGPVDRLDRRADPRAARRVAVHRQRAGRPRSQGRVPRAVRGAPQRGLLAHQGRRRAAHARRAADARQEVQAHDRGGRRPARDEGGSAHTAHTVGRDRGRARRGPRRRRPRRQRRVDHVLAELRVSGARRVARRAAAAHLLVQLAARSLSALHRARRAAGDRSRPARPRSVAVDRRRRAGAVGGRRLGVLRVGDPGDRRPLRDPDRRAVGGADRRPAVALPRRHRRRQGVRPVPQPDGASPLVHGRLRGDRHVAAAPVPRDGLVDAARAHRGVHVVPPVPGLQGGAAQAGSAGRHGRPQEHPRVHAPVDHARARVPGFARPDRDRAADRRADRQGDPRTADLPRRRRCRLPEPRPRVGDALRRRGAAAAARDADRLTARRRAVHPRRAVDRPAPARQRQVDRHARAAPQPRQHRGRGRARRADDAQLGLARRHGARRRRARRARRRRGHGGQGHAEQEVGHRAVPLRHARRSRCPSGAPRITAGSACSALPSTT